MDICKLDDYTLPVGESHVTALGNFDGVHIAHTALLEKTVEEARKSGIFYVSAHVADQDCNPWHLGGIATYAFYDDGLAENSEIYTISQDIEGVVHRLTLVREHLDTGADWIFEYRVGWDNFEVVNNSEEYPEPSELV